MLSALRYYRSTETGRLVARDGTRFRYLAAGYGDETVLVIPGIEDSVTHFEHVPWFWSWYYRPLADPGRRVVVLGRPRGLPDSTSTEGLAKTYAEAIDEHFGPSHIVGISMGGLIAQHLAASRPELVRRLALTVTATKVGGVSHGERLVALAEANRWHGFATEANAICFAGWLRTLVTVLLLLFAPLFWLGQALLRGTRAARDFRISAEACAAHDGTGLVRAITAPTLVWGAHGDCLFPAAFLAETASSLPRGELSMIDGAHAAFLQERNRFHAVLHGFFSRVEVPQGDTPAEPALAREVTA